MNGLKVAESWSEAIAKSLTKKNIMGLLRRSSTLREVSYAMTVILLLKNKNRDAPLK
ncbi:MAG: hypothetical protein F6K22_36905 [Okeania sp. SIO2F4]|nr:hypothetical protein [Okeania sp. SIO2F4]